MTLSLIAAGVSFVLTLLIGKFLIPELHKLKAGQEIREDGPTWHKAKAGTPTMGGIMFILGAGVTIFVLGWRFMLEGQFSHLYVYLFALIFGLIGFVDDYRKVRQHQNEGLTARQKFILQLAAAVVFLVLMRYEGLLTNDLYIPFLNISFTINWIVYLIFAAFVIVGCVNAVNLTDGIDGLASSVTFVVMAPCSRRPWRGGLRPSSSTTTTRPRSLWATPAASSWGAPWRPWPLCSTCPWC